MGMSAGFAQHQKSDGFLAIFLQRPPYLLNSLRLKRVVINGVAGA